MAHVIINSVIENTNTHILKRTYQSSVVVVALVIVVEAATLKTALHPSTANYNFSNHIKERKLKNS